MTDELLKFACDEFNYYPKFLASLRTRPPYIKEDVEWPPRWVNQTGAKGPMHCTPKTYLKNLAILYLLGVKHLNTANLDDLFGNDPFLREEWLCQLTTRRELGRFLRQVRVSCTFFSFKENFSCTCTPRVSHT